MATQKNCNSHEHADRQEAKHKGEAKYPSPNKFQTLKCFLENTMVTYQTTTKCVARHGTSVIAGKLMQATSIMISTG